MGSYLWNLAQSIYLENVWDFQWIRKMGIDYVLQTLQELQQDGDRDVTHQDVWDWYRCRSRSSTEGRTENGAAGNPEVSVSWGICRPDHESPENTSMPTATPKLKKTKLAPVRKSSRTPVPTFKAAQKKMPPPKIRKRSGPNKKAPDESVSSDSQVTKGPGRPRKNVTEAPYEKRTVKVDQESQVTICQAPEHSDNPCAAEKSHMHGHDYASPASSLDLQSVSGTTAETAQNTLRSPSDIKLNLSACRVRPFTRRPRPQTSPRPSDPEPVDKFFTEFQNIPNSAFRPRHTSTTMVTVLSSDNRMVQLHVRLGDPENIDVDVETVSSATDDTVFAGADKLSFDELSGSANDMNQSASSESDYPDNFTQDGSKFIIHVKPAIESNVCQTTAGSQVTDIVQSGQSVSKVATSFRESGSKASKCAAGVGQKELQIGTHSSAPVQSCSSRVPRFPKGIRQTRPMLDTHSLVSVQTGSKGPRIVTDFGQSRRGRPRLRKSDVQMHSGTSVSAASSAKHTKRRLVNARPNVSVRNRSTEQLRTETAQRASSFVTFTYVGTSPTCSLPNASAKSSQSWSAVTVSQSTTRLSVDSSSNRPRDLLTPSLAGNSHPSVTTGSHTHKDRRASYCSASGGPRDVLSVDLNISVSEAEFDFTDSEINFYASAFSAYINSASDHSQPLPRLSSFPDFPRLPSRPSSVSGSVSSIDSASRHIRPLPRLSPSQDSPRLLSRPSSAFRSVSSISTTDDDRDLDRFLDKHWQQYFRLCRQYTSHVLDRDQLRYLLAYAQLNDSPSEECLLVHIKKRIAVNSQQLLNWFDFFREVVKPRLHNVQLSNFMEVADFINYTNFLLQDKHPRH